MKKHIYSVLLFYKFVDNFKKRQCLGGLCDGGTPVPIPNTAVKPISADGSRKARVGRRQDIGSFLFKKHLRRCFCISISSLISNVVVLF